MWITFFLPICFGLNSGPQSKKSKWLVRRGKEDSQCQLLILLPTEGPSCPLLCGCPCHTIPVGRHLHIPACLQIGVFNSLYSLPSTKMVNPLPSSSQKHRTFFTVKPFEHNLGSVNCGIEYCSKWENCTCKCISFSEATADKFFQLTTVSPRRFVFFTFLASGLHK